MTRRLERGKNLAQPVSQAHTEPRRQSREPFWPGSISRSVAFFPEGEEAWKLQFRTSFCEQRGGGGYLGAK